MLFITIASRKLKHNYQLYACSCIFNIKPKYKTTPAIIPKMKTKSKKIVLDYKDLRRFPKRETICDFTNLNNIKWSFVYLETIGPNIKIWNYKKSDFVSLCNWDLYRINSPYFQNMKDYKKVIFLFLKEQKISVQELLFY